MAKALRYTLSIAAFATALIVVILWLVGGLTGRDLALAVASAGVAIVGSLLITEVVLKPLYTRDIIELAQADARLAALGVVDVAPERRVDETLLAGSSVVSVVSSDPSAVYQKLWPAIRRSAEKRKVDVTITLPSDPGGGTPKEVTEMERQWKSSSARTRGGSIVIQPGVLPIPRLVLITDVSACTCLGNVSGEPLVLVSKDASDSMIRDYAQRAIDEAVGEVPGPPWYKS